MPASDIVIKGAREHNLRSVDLVLPRNKLICLTGVSGSGKSSLAFDTLFAEGQRRYVESLSSYARHLLGQMPKPDVDLIAGLSPSISISQKTSGKNPRSTVGTITEIYDYLRVLYARVGDAHCPLCSQPIVAQTREQIIEPISALPDDTHFSVLAPLIRGQKGEYRDLFLDLLKQGFVRARVDGETVRLTDDLRLDRQMRHSIEVVVDRLQIKKGARTRVAEAVDLALKLGKGNLIVHCEPSEGADAPQERSKTKRVMGKSHQEGDIVFSSDYACPDCGLGFDPLSPQLFSFNSPHGMCLECDGLGEAYTFDVELLVPNPSLCVKDGCFDLLGKWKQLGRWRRHVFQGMANTMERVLELDEGTFLETPWEDLGEQVQNCWLWGTGDQHLTLTWRSGASPIKYGGTFEGIVPELISKYRNSKSTVQVRKLEQYMRTMECPDCGGKRLNAYATAVRTRSSHPDYDNPLGHSLPDVCNLSILEATKYFSGLKLDEVRTTIAAQAIKEIQGRLGFLIDVGLDYLTLGRTAPTLSGGESQRIRLAGQIGCGLVGVLYILDEPSIGLHPRDNDRLLRTLGRLRDLGNTVVVVEHDEDTMLASDHIIDFGPGPGVRGGYVVAEGDLDTVCAQKESVTGQFLSGKRSIAVPDKRREPTDAMLTVVGARHNNLKNIDVEIPLGVLVCVTGVSGSGKSSMVNDILVQALRRDLNRGEGIPGEHERIEGMDHLDKLIAIDQSPIGRTPRSNPGTYIKVFDDIRKLFTQLPEAKRRGYKAGRFSFNVDGGRCQACGGNGSNKLEMDFLADIWVTCPVCEGHRFNRETLGIKFKDHSISQVLEMDVQQAMVLFENIPNIHHKLSTLHAVGLDYLKLGQPSTTLSGGEAQRIKLARELVKRSTGKTLYLLDEPTTGLHFADIQLLLDVLQGFVEAGNTVLVVEHNLDVVKTADWVIDLGPDGGAGGGHVIAAGPPELVAENPKSFTGQALAEVLSTGGRHASNGSAKKKSPRRQAVELAKYIDVQGARQHNLKDVSLKIPRDEMTVFCGPSGSGKSSLAMDTIYAEGQRRYVESLSSYARQFVSQMQKPDVQHVEGLSPAIAIEQQNLGSSPRSTVGTSTEIYDYLRILLARLGEPHCPQCDVKIGTQTADEVIDRVMQEDPGTRLYLMAPVVVDVGETYEAHFDQLRSSGYLRIRVDGETHSLDDAPDIDRRRQHEVTVVVDRVVIREDNRSRVAESIEAALSLGRGVMHVAQANDKIPEKRWPVKIHSQHLVCENCGRSFQPLSPHNFSFNSQLGWCNECEGLGTQMGANPAVLVRDPQTTIADGALLLWPDLDKSLSQRMLQALGQQVGVPIDLPFDQLSARQRRMIMHGTGDQWIEVPKSTVKKIIHPFFRFQFKGLYPVLDEASRQSVTLRAQINHLIDEVECSSCAGSRLRDDAGAVRFRNRTVDQWCQLPFAQLQTEIKKWRLSARDKKIAGELVREITTRVKFLNDVGLEYLTLSRAAATLSGGEAQRIRLASQIGSGLCGVLYVLDEPTIGLHPRDNGRLLTALHDLRDLGNTLIVVEHDRDVITGSDNVMDFGPKAGKHGGELVAQGTPEQITQDKSSVTGPYLAEKKVIPIPTNRRPVNIPAAEEAPSTPAPSKPAPSKPAVSKPTPEGRRSSKSQPAPADAPACPPSRLLEIQGARHNNLKNIDVRIPLGTLTVVTGVSGSGKSSLVNDIIHAALASQLHRAKTIAGPHDRILGIEHLNKVIRVDQKPLGNSPTSNPATYTGAFELIRQLFSQLPESKLRGYGQRMFSFNVAGGRCEECEGNGQIRIEMHFLPDVWVTCDECNGSRYKKETLEVCFRGHSISDVLEMTCGEAVELFHSIPKIRRILQTLCDVGLDYVNLGQPAPTLSGGEAQRVKLASELSRPDTGQTLYLLDEPTTGLHFEDLTKLIDVLQRLVDLGNTVVVVEHNMDVIKSADWIIDMGPEAGAEGGHVIAVGTPERIAENGNGGAGVPPTKKKTGAKSNSTNGRSSATNGHHRSYTAEALAPILARGTYQPRGQYDPFVDEVDVDEERLEIKDVGRGSKMPWEIDGRQWHCVDRVGRGGEPVRWNGHVLEAVVDAIHEMGEFAETNWNTRSVVEITAAKKSLGWFMHAITGECWLLKLKFRVARNTFKKEELLEQILLPTLNEMEDLPIYGNDPRVICRQSRGPFQEISIRIHSWDEIDTPEFWQFLEDAVEGFQKMAHRKDANPEDHMPWKKLGEKWHFSHKGFPPGQPVKWEQELLEELCDMLQETAEAGQFLWNNQTVVHMFVEEQKEPWASVHTKRPHHLDLVLTGPKGRVALGRVANLGREPNLEAGQGECDKITLRFHKKADLHKGDLSKFLAEHISGVVGTNVAIH